MSEAFQTSLEIQSHRGSYICELRRGQFNELASMDLAGKSFIVDSKVAKLYPREMEKILASSRCLLIEATEENKNLDRFTSYIETLSGQGIRRGDLLVAIGGGIIQDITCFIASVLFRGLDWTFYPTTLLAQADSGIGSKSSINVGEIKNLLGTFTPPKRVCVDPSVLRTLGQDEIRSGIGEMLKVHLIDGPESFRRIAADYDRMVQDGAVLLKYVDSALRIKKRFIESDEFDRGIRNVLNYGHSFGHAIETATEFAIPHGVAVTMGMDMANFVSEALGFTSAEHAGYFREVHHTLWKNYKGFENQEIPLDRFFRGISKDKKNTGSKLGLILPGKDAIPARVYQVNDEHFQTLCRSFFSEVRKSS